MEIITSDIFVHICDYMDKYSLVKLSATNKYFRDLYKTCYKFIPKKFNEYGCLMRLYSSMPIPQKKKFRACLNNVELCDFLYNSYFDIIDTLNSINYFSDHTIFYVACHNNNFDHMMQLFKKK